MLSTQVENERDARLELAQRMSQTAELVPQSAYQKVLTVSELAFAVVAALC